MNNLVKIVRNIQVHLITGGEGGRAVNSHILMGGQSGEGKGY